MTLQKYCRIFTIAIRCWLSVSPFSKVNQMTDTTNKGTALITGASTGMGAIYADRLARRGHDLILVARNGERLHKLAGELTAATGRKITSIVADLTDKVALARVEEVLRSDTSITMLVNNAGVGSVASILKADVDTMESMIALNVTALTRLTYAVAPAFVSRNAGTIVNIASVVGVAAELLNGVYGASKSYVISFGHTLQRDLADKGVRIQTVMPGATATEFWDVAGYAAQKQSATTMSAANLVDAALAGLDAGELVTIPGLHEGDKWTQWEADRRALTPKFANAAPAARYGLAR
jgi:short-subunit dehydrogenase